MVSLLLRLLTSINLDVLFKSSPGIRWKALIIPRNCRISRSVFCDASHVLARISSTKNESSSSGMLSISKSVGNSRLSLVATVKDPSKTGGALSVPKKVVCTPSNLPLRVFGVKNL